MTADELLIDLTERLAEANSRLLAMAAEKREASLGRTFNGQAISVEADRLEAKADGVRLALSYCNEAHRFTGEPQ